MSTRYLIEFKTTGASVLLEYNADGCLNYYEQNGPWKLFQFENFFKVYPFKIQDLQFWRDNAAKYKVKVSEVAEDLSFDRFWDEYKHKVGNKQRAKKLWDALAQQDQILALNYLPIYSTHLAQNPGQQKLYAETYLNQRRWDV